MYVVTNRIKMKKGYAEKLAPMFTKGGALQEMKGFIKVETWNMQDIEEHDLLHVNMWWETLEDFEAWKTSDALNKHIIVMINLKMINPRMNKAIHQC